LLQHGSDYTSHTEKVIKPLDIDGVDKTFGGKLHSIQSSVWY